jgi:hypothetical protein
MSNQLVSGGTIAQGTTLGLDFANQLITGGAKQETSQACIVDLVPPVFSGIDFVTRGSLGQIRAAWLPGTDTSLPISYEIYIKPNTSFDLFQTSNITAVTRQLSCDVFSLPNGTLLQSGVTYYVGVRAIDAVGNRDTNTVILNQSSSGILGVTSGQITGVFAIDEQNQLIATFWANDTEGIIDNPGRLGPASYEIYDQNGLIVPSMMESNIAANSEGFFKITPVPSVLDLYNTYYTVKVTIEIDSVDITYNLPITYPEAGPQYEPRAVFSINAANELQGSIWIVKDNQKMTSSLGVASYTIRNRLGALVGISQSNIAQTNGYYQITPVLASVLVDLNHYTVDVLIEADGVVRSGVVGLVIGE